MRYQVLGIAVFVVAMVVPTVAQDAMLSVPTIVTSGEASVKRAPDQAFVAVAVETRAKAPRDAQQQNATAMAAVQLRLTGAGIAKDAVRTTGYNIQQEFDFAGGRRTPREYVARNGVEIRLDAIDRVGEILDLTVQAGATSVSSVRFEVKDRAGAEREALRLAVTDARGRADALAAGAGRTVDRILRIDDGPRQYRGPLLQGQSMMRAGADVAMDTPIAAGEVEIRAQVTLTVAIK